MLMAMLKQQTQYDPERRRLGQGSGTAIVENAILLSGSVYERPAAVKVAFCEAKRTLDGEDRSEIIPAQGVAQDLPQAAEGYGFLPRNT